MSSITGASKESINGVKFTLIYNAVETVVGINTPSKIKSKSIRQVASKNSYAHCLRIVVDEHELYYFSPKVGLSFARQIEAFISNSANETWQVADSVLALIIPLDNHVYIAQIENCEVIRENVLIPSVAQDRINEISQTGQSAFWLAGGATKADISVSGLTEVVDFDLSLKPGDRTSFSYKSLWLLMIRHRLYHPSQLLFTLPALIAIGIVATGYANYRFEIEAAIEKAQELVEKNRRIAKKESEEETKLNEANHSASVNLIAFLDEITFAETVLGIQEVRWSRTKIEMTGSQHNLMSSAKQFDDRAGWIFKPVNSGWIATKEEDAYTDNKPTVATTETMRASLFSLAAVSQGSLIITKVTTSAGYEVIEFTLTIPTGITAAISELAKAVQNRPYRLTTAICRFVGWRTTGCEATFTAKYKTTL